MKIIVILISLIFIISSINIWAQKVYYPDKVGDLIIIIAEKLNFKGDINSAVEFLKNKDIKFNKNLNSFITPLFVKNLLKQIKNRKEFEEIRIYLEKLLKEKNWTIAKPIEP